MSTRDAEWAGGGTSASFSGRVVANMFSGADIGAQINAACAALPSGGVVEVLDGDYVQTTRVVITTGITVKLGKGTISNSLAAGAPHWQMQDDTGLIGSGRHTKIMAQVQLSGGAGAITVSDYVSATDNAQVGNSGLIVRDIQFIRNPASTIAGTQSAAVQFGNVTDASVRWCYFNGCEGYGVFQASSSTLGHSGNGFVVEGCTFDNITTQHCGAINCNNFSIRNNLFRPTTTTGNYTIIDCESNTGTDILRNFDVSGNIFDFRTSAIFNPGGMIQIVGGQSTTAYTGVGRACYGVVSRNICVSGTPSGAVYFSNGINLVNCDYVEVSDNQIHFANLPIETATCRSCTIKDNTTGTGGNNEAWHIQINDSFDCTVQDNKCTENSGDTAHSTPNIAEGGTSDYNTFSGNRAAFYPDATPGAGTDRYAKITIVGTHSRVFNSAMGATPTPVDAPLITSIAELRALYPPGARPAAAPPVVVVGGYSAQADGGWSVWSYASASAATDNGITVVVPNYRPGATGAWLRAPGDIQLTTTARNALSLTAADAGLTIWNTTTSRLDTWNGSAWTSTGPQAVTLVGTNTISPAAGYYVKATYTSATNVTAMTISAGIDGQVMTVQLSQPAAGTAATMVTTWTNVNFAGGTGSFTATLGKHDVYRFIYDATAAKWQEVSRSLNQTN